MRIYTDVVSKTHEYFIFMEEFILKSVKKLYLGLMLMMLSVLLIGCQTSDTTTDSNDDSATESVSHTTDKDDEEDKDSSRIDEDENEDKDSSSADERADSESESSDTATSDSESDTSSTSRVTQASSSSTASSSSVTATSSATSSRTTQTHPTTTGVPDNKVSTAGDSRVWGDSRTILYYTPAQNYRGYRPRNAVPFADEAAAQAAGYQQSPRRPRY